jgi:expansin (peptidoglycan-binding protein)
MMPTHSWWRRSRVLFAALPFLPLACVSGTEPPGDVSGAGRGTGGSGSGLAGKPNGGSAGAVTGGSASTGGSGGTTSAGGTTSTGGSGGGVSSAGGMAGTGGTSLAGAGGSVSAGTGGAIGNGGSVTAGGGGTGGSGATGGSSGTSAGQGATGGTVSDPCAGVTCGSGQTCSNGTCMCMTGTLCSGSCIDTTADVNNCGGCGTKCDSGGSCVDGKCVNPMCNPDTMTRSGHVTHYTLGSNTMVACHYETGSLPTYYGAMNEYDWNSAAVCGACVEITNGGSKVVVQIVDQCPYKGNEQWCFQGSHHIDLNPSAAGALGASNTNPAVTWKFVSCTPADGIKYYIDKASKSDYVSVSPLNIKNPVAKMEVKKGAAFSAMPRNNSNMFEGTGGPFSGSITLRLTDIYNHVITDTVMMSPGQTVQGNAQFPACP